MRIQRSNPPELYNSLKYGFSQAVSATGSRLIAISGQVAWNPRLELIGGQSLGEQSRAALKNLNRALEALGAGLQDVLSLRLYIVDFQQQDSAVVTAALQEFFPTGAAPAATWIGVSSLARSDLKIEIEALALGA